MSKDEFDNELKILIIKWLRKHVPHWLEKYGPDYINNIEKIYQNEFGQLEVSYNTGYIETIGYLSQHRNFVPEFRVKDKKLQYRINKTWVTLIDFRDLIKDSIPRPTGISSPQKTRLSIEDHGIGITDFTERINFTGFSNVKKLDNTSVEVQVPNWIVISQDQILENNTAYILQSNTELEITLPSEANVGDTIKIMGYGNGGFKISQNSNQKIWFGNKETTIGTNGNLKNLQEKSSLELVCVISDNEFMVANSIGNFNLQ